jgi:hypothetical protein
MQCDAISFAFDLVLRIIRAGVMDTAFVVLILGVHAHDPAAHPLASERQLT